MITRLKISNFKSLRELEVEFGRLTVIVGANGCGKSSVLQAILAVRELVGRKRLSDERFPMAAMSRGPDADEVASAVNFEIAFESDCVFAGVVSVDATLASTFDLQCATADHIDLNRSPPDRLVEWAHHVQLYSFDKTIMEAPAYSNTPHPVLGRRGEDLPAVLDALQGEHREQFVAIEAGLCEFIDDLERIRLRRVRVPTGPNMSGIGHQILFDFKHARGIPADQASEGTVLLLGLLTVIGTELGPPVTIMLDDLDRGLHPKAQKQLIEYLRKLLDQRPDLQIIATTHSPYLVEYLNYEEVRAMTRSVDDGSSLIAPLVEHPDADRWREEMSAGEFWSSVGEEWVARGR